MELTDTQIVQNRYHAGSYFDLKNDTNTYILLRVDWVNKKIEYRAHDNYSQRLYGSLNDIKMIGDIRIAWRNVKLDELIELK